MASADYVLHNANVLTMETDAPSAQAIAIAEGKFMSVGSNEDVLALAGNNTEVRNLSGRTIMPGLVDTHSHHNMAGEADLFFLKISPTATVEEIVQRVAEWTKTLQPGDWVLGESWGSGLYADLSSPEALAKLDAASHDHPVLLTDDSHHNKWANTRAMEIGGIFDLKMDPEGGQVVRDLTGNPTGLLIESAGALVEQARLGQVGSADLDHVAASSERAVEILHQFGITAFQDAAASKDVMAGLKLLDEQKRLKAWVVSSMLINDLIFGTPLVGEPLISSGEQFRTLHHRPDFTKIFLDGVPPSRTGAFLEPYLPDNLHGHDHCGGTTMPSEELEDWLRRCSELHLGAKIHCTGDASVRLVLDTAEKLRAEGKDLPLQIAHGNYVHPDDVPRFAQLNVVAEISPALWFPGVIVEALRSVIPEPRASHIHPNRDLLEAGALIAAGSDWPVAESPNPWPAIYGLVTRKDPSGSSDEQLWPEQALTVEEALRAYTTGPAQAMGLGDSVGRVKPGYFADFIVMERNPLTVDPEELTAFAPAETWFNGERVFDAKACS